MAKKIPDCVMIVHDVDNGAACIGEIECPHCGRSHYSTYLTVGGRKVLCGLGITDSPGINENGWSEICIIRVE